MTKEARPERRGDRVKEEGAQKMGAKARAKNGSHDPEKVVW